jgi:hypothetical protein
MVVFCHAHTVDLGKSALCRRRKLYAKSVAAQAGCVSAVPSLCYVHAALQCVWLTRTLMTLYASEPTSGMPHIVRLIVLLTH